MSKSRKPSATTSAAGKVPAAVSRYMAAQQAKSAAALRGTETARTRAAKAGRSLTPEAALARAAKAGATLRGTETARLRAIKAATARYAKTKPAPAPAPTAPARVRRKQKKTVHTFTAEEIANLKPSELYVDD